MTNNHNNPKRLEALARAGMLTRLRLENLAESGRKGLTLAARLERVNMLACRRRKSR